MKIRLNHQKADANNSLILISTVVMFFIFHSPRVIISIYEGITIQNVLTCNEKRKGFHTIWYLYVQNTLQFVQASACPLKHVFIFILQVMRCSSNLPIYMLVSDNFKNYLSSWIKNKMKYISKLIQAGKLYIFHFLSFIFDIFIYLDPDLKEADEPSFVWTSKV